MKVINTSCSNEIKMIDYTYKRNQFANKNIKQCV